MKWFGKDWGAPVCKSNPQTDVPLEPCVVCGKKFTERDSGLLLPFCGNPGDPPELGYHVECLVESMCPNPIKEFIH